MQTHSTTHSIAIVKHKKPIIEIPISEMNASSRSFSFLKNEQDIYTLNDLKGKYV